jgi:hypothetical protein
MYRFVFIFSFLFFVSVDVMSIDRRNFEQQNLTSRRVRELYDAYLASDLLEENKVKVTEQVDRRSEGRRPAVTSKKVVAPGWFRIFGTVYK